MGLILTPSSTWALLASSESLWVSTLLPQSVLTKVVRPIQVVSQGREVMVDRDVGVARSREGHVPVPEAPQTIKQN